MTKKLSKLLLEERIRLEDYIEIEIIFLKYNLLKLIIQIYYY